MKTAYAIVAGNLAVFIYSAVGMTVDSHCGGCFPPPPVVIMLLAWATIVLFARFLIGYLMKKGVQR